MAIFLVSPETAGWIVRPLTSAQHFGLPNQTPPLAPVAWAVLLLPVVLAATFSAVAVLQQVTLRHQVIIADDTGIAVRWWLSRRRHMHWENVRLLTLMSRRPQITAYWLRGERSGLILDLGPLSTASESDTARRSPFRYEGGIVSYSHQVDRLLATIVARGRVPLRTLAVGYYQHAGGAVASADGLTAAEVLSMPPASASYRPSAAAVEREMASAVPIWLSARTPWRMLGQWARTYGVGYGIVALVFDGFAFFFYNLSADPAHQHASMVSFIFVLVAFLLVAVVGGGALSGNAAYRTASPGIGADEDGLTSHFGNNKQLATIAWADIHAWGVIRPGPLTSEATVFAIFANELVIQWSEPVEAELAGREVIGDRRAAYHATAETLHARIAARTGLELREITARDGTH